MIQEITCAYAQCNYVVPVAMAAALFQASIYDVPGGYRAVMLDRFSGVKDKVRCLPVHCVTMAEPASS